MTDTLNHLIRCLDNIVVLDYRVSRRVSVAELRDFDKADAALNKYKESLMEAKAVPKCSNSKQ